MKTLLKIGNFELAYDYFLEKDLFPITFQVTTPTISFFKYEKAWSIAFIFFIFDLQFWFNKDE